MSLSLKKLDCKINFYCASLLAFNILLVFILCWFFNKLDVIHDSAISHYNTCKKNYSDSTKLKLWAENYSNAYMGNNAIVLDDDDLYAYAEIPYSKIMLDITNYLGVKYIYNECGEIVLVSQEED